jgi:hypothetical protein
VPLVVLIYILTPYGGRELVLAARRWPGHRGALRLHFFEREISKVRDWRAQSLRAGFGGKVVSRGGPSSRTPCIGLSRVLLSKEGEEKRTTGNQKRDDPAEGRGRRRRYPGEAELPALRLEELARQLPTLREAEAPDLENGSRGPVVEQFANPFEIV